MMGYTIVDRSTCPDCHGPIVQLLLDTDIDGNDDYAGVGWFHVISHREVHALCPLKAHPPCTFCGRTDIAPDENCPWGCKTRTGSGPSLPKSPPRYRP